MSLLSLLIALLLLAVAFGGLAPASYRGPHYWWAWSPTAILLALPLVVLLVG